MGPESIQKAPKNPSKNKTEKVGSSGAESGRRGGPLPWAEGVPFVDNKEAKVTQTPETYTKHQQQEYED